MQTIALKVGDFIHSVSGSRMISYRRFEITRLTKTQAIAEIPETGTVWRFQLEAKQYHKGHHFYLVSVGSSWAGRFLLETPQLVKDMREAEERRDLEADLRAALPNEGAVRHMSDDYIRDLLEVIQKHSKKEEVVK